jgi:hypothetical protein
MEVKKLEMYHISKIINNKRYSSGDIIKTEGYNPFFSVYDESEVSFNSEFESLFKGLTYYWHFARETVLEEVRKQINPDLPSRLKCLWLCDVKSLDYWMTTMRYNPNSHQVLKVSVDGNLFKCDASYIEGNPRKLNDLRNESNKYWNGEMSGNNKVEYLLEGEATVLEELNFKHETITS